MSHNKSTLFIHLFIIWYICKLNFLKSKTQPPEKWITWDRNWNFSTIYMWYACVPAFALLMSYSYHAWAYVCSVSVYSEIWILIFFLFLLQKTRDLLVLSSTVSSTLSPPILSFYLTPFIFLLFLLCRSIVTPYTYSLSLSLSLIEAKGNTKHQSPFTIYDPLFFNFLNWLVLLIRTLAWNETHSFCAFWTHPRRVLWLMIYNVTQTSMQYNM